MYQIIFHHRRLFVILTLIHYIRRLDICIKQIFKRLAEFQFLIQRRSETSFPNIFNQNFKEMDRPFKISKILQIVITLLFMYSYCNLSNDMVTGNSKIITSCRNFLVQPSGTSTRQNGNSRASTAIWLTYHKYIFKLKQTCLSF